jgi:hypothetical protein
LKQIESLIEAMDIAGTDAERSNLFYRVKPLLVELEATQEAKHDGYIGEKLGSLRSNLASLTDREDSNAGVDYAQAARVDVQRLRTRAGFCIGL